MDELGTEGEEIDWEYVTDDDMSASENEESK